MKRPPVQAKGRGVGLDPQQLAPFVRDISAAIGVDHRKVRLVRIAANAVYASPECGLVIRVADATASGRVRRAVTAAQVFESAGLPAVRLWPDCAEVVRDQGFVATLWEYVPEARHPPAFADLGALLQKLHAIPVSPRLTPWDPVGEIREHLDATTQIEESTRLELLDRCAELEEGLRSIRWSLQPSVIHGDAWIGNVLGGRGQAKLGDLDQVAIGPPEWDLVPTVVNALRFGRDHHEVRELMDAYGFDVTTWAGLPVLRQLRELTTLAGVLPVVSSHRVIREEFQRRLRDVLDRAVGTYWTPYP